MQALHGGVGWVRVSRRGCQCQRSWVLAKLGAAETAATVRYNEAIRVCVWKLCARKSGREVQNRQQPKNRMIDGS